jgi:4-amino-4-deoxy-L-arabinose transferase-like glycosyltransferase
MRSAAPDPEPRGLATAWATLCAVALGLVFASSFVWIDHNPSPIDWDNAEYLNMVTEDHHAYRRDGLIGALRSLVTVDPARPPAYRIVVLPMTMLGGASLLLLRLTSVVLMASMAVMVHLAVSRVAGRSAGLLAAALVVSLVTVSQSMRIYRTETALYPCVIAMLLCLIAGIDRDRVRPPLWLALGATIGLGRCRR